MTAFSAAVDAILAEMLTVLAGMDEAEVERLIGEVAAARRVVAYGVGRNGLVLQALAMRLMHLGLDAHFVGDMATPPVGTGDLVLAVAALGRLPTVDAITRQARAAGARIAVISARPEAVPVADLVVRLPGRTMNDTTASVMLLGGQFELALSILSEIVATEVLRRRGTPEAAARARHANLL